jgi:hypothetical protein
MAWNYENGCEETVAYTVLSHGPVTPKATFANNPLEFGEEMNRVRIAVYEWQVAEGWLKGGKWHNNRDIGVAEVLKKWGRAEMAIVNWNKHGDQEKFRVGYLEWLAKGNQIADDVGLSDLEIEKLPSIERIIAKGYRELAKEAHPDTGGTPEKFRDLRTAKLQLDRMLMEVGDLLKESA